MNEFEHRPGQGPLDPKKLLQQAIAGGDESAAAAGWQPPSLEQLDARFPELEIVELIGRGGMGAVYRAVQAKLARTVALKVLPPELAADPAFEERFLREARALASLEHPRILTVHDFGERDGCYYLVTEFVEGMNLRQLMDMGELSPAEALRLTPQVCEALQYAHDHGVVHRDIKPENLLVDGNGELKIADFGLARIVGEQSQAPALTRSTQVLGTPHYMAPEQWRSGASVDHRADIYSVGVVLYEMLTGQLPLGHFDPPSSRDGVPKGLDQVVRRSLAQRPEQRYQRASEVGEELLRQHAEQPRSPAPSRGAARASHSNVGAPAATRAAWLMIAVMLVGAVWAAQAMMRASTEYHRAESDYEARLAEAEYWATSSDRNFGSDQELIEAHYRDELVKEWQQRREAAEEARMGFFEPAPELPKNPTSNPSMAASFLFAGGLGVGSLLFSVLGFVGLSQIVQRRRGTGGLGLTVFTAWVGPVTLAATIPAVILSENIHDNDTAVIVATIIAVVMAVLGIVFMVWQYHRLSARIVDDGPGPGTGAAVLREDQSPYPLIVAAWLVVLLGFSSVLTFTSAAFGIGVIELLIVAALIGSVVMACGFAAVGRVRRNRSKRGVGVSVFTAWLFPLLFLSYIAVVIAANVARGTEHMQTTVSIVALVALVGSFWFMIAERERVLRDGVAA